MITKNISTRCCISGGGPAGIMTGFLLARSGIDVVVLEKWPDFFRDFRGDTIHPSTMEILSELGLLEEFLKLPHDEVLEFEVTIGKEKVTIANFSHLKTVCPFIAFIPQWDFLNFISNHAKKYPKFHLLMETEATDLIKKNGKVVGVKAKDKDGEFEIHSGLVIGADGRHSTIREKSNLVTETVSSPIDVLWFRLSRKQNDQEAVLGKIDKGQMMIMIDRKDYWQCGFIIQKGDFEKIKSAGIESFRKRILSLVPGLTDQTSELKDFDQIKLLTVTIDRLKTWHEYGLLCIGDSAHAMSPIGGVGINLAIQDAVATANILVPAFQKGMPTQVTLAKVQKRRSFSTKIIQKIQALIQNKIIISVLDNETEVKLPWQLKLFQKFPYLRRLPAYFIGMGFRREHIETKEIL